MYDDVAQLVESVNRRYDSYGNETVGVDAHDVYVQPRSIYHSEFYAAAQAGLTPTVALYMTNRFDYHGEKQVIYRDSLYDVIRVDWVAQKDGITLICSPSKNGDNIMIIEPK